MDVYQDGYLLPPFPFYFTCQVVNGANYTRFFFPELFIDADHFYRVDIQYAVGYGPNCSEVPG
jgi:hypothetical protein